MIQAKNVSKADCFTDQVTAEAWQTVFSILLIKVLFITFSHVFNSVKVRNTSFVFLKACGVAVHRHKHSARQVHKSAC